MLIVARAVGQVLRMRTEAGSDIEIIIDQVRPHVVRLAIKAPQSVKIDVKADKPTQSADRIAPTK